MSISSLSSVNFNLPTQGARSNEAPMQKENNAPAKDSVSLGQGTAEPAPTAYSKDVSLLAKKNDCQGDESKLIVASGTDGDDVINVTRGENYGVKVSVNGKESSYSFGDTRFLVIDGGKGNDVITVDPSIGTQLFITGGEGNDSITSGQGNDFIIDNYGCNTIDGGKGDDVIIAQGLDFQPGSGNIAPGNYASRMPNAQLNGNVLIGGEGSDYLEGGKGNDLLIGGNGNDVIYGLQGDDMILAGEGNNYVDGGKGNDIIRAGNRSNIIYGGSGDDSIRTGKGVNAVITGAGHDSVSVSGNYTTVTHTAGDEISGTAKSTQETEVIAVPANLYAQGDESFTMRVDSDLEALASAPLTQNMLNGIGNTSHKTVIVETDGGNKCSHGTGSTLEDDHRTPGAGSDATVYYNPSRVHSGGFAVWSDRPPIIGLYHEMAHAYNSNTGTMDNWAYNYDGSPATDRYGLVGAEFQAVGIENRSIKPNPEGISENDLRAFLNLVHRDRY